MAQESHGCGMSSQQKQHDKQDTEIKESLAHIRNKILVMSGKGGVGKSTVAAYLSIVLAKRGHRVGLMDVDLHGPSIPRLLGLKGTPQPSTESDKALPIEILPDLHVMSIEPLMNHKDTATIWRGPLKIGVIRQFLADIEWSELDYLIIDAPPGTGDEPLTIAQTIPDAKALIVTTPQEISLADVRKSINFCRQVKMDILGLVENMGAFACPHCGEKIDLFKADGGQITASKTNLRLLATLPIQPEVVRLGDDGKLALLLDQELPFVQEFDKMVDDIEKATSTKSSALPAKDASKTDVKKENGKMMKFAIPVADGRLAAHFGHCEQFALIETENGEIKNSAMQTPPPHEPGVLPQWLHEQGANVIIAGGMGSRAQQLFGQNGIEVVVGAPSDSPEALVKQYLNNNLATGPNVCDH
jgi:Mrp family chromosome partitioning ATPase/predicted Fe-Mo cluster-binding NifX family protein